jgi:hypothetical protein
MNRQAGEFSQNCAGMVLKGGTWLSTAASRLSGYKKAILEDRTDGRRGRRRCRGRWLVQIVPTAILAFGPALAAPPDNFDPKLSPWFDSLRQPGTGAGCCSIADCRLPKPGKMPRATRSR